MQTLDIYKYRALKVTYTNLCQAHGVESKDASQQVEKLNACWDALSKYERRVVASDEGLTLVLVDVDVNKHKGWPARVWERECEKLSTLRDLTDWTDRDVATFILARSLGILQEGDTFIVAKHIFCSRNPLGDALDDMLMRLVDVDILLHREPEQQLRWNYDFKPIKIRAEDK